MSIKVPPFDLPIYQFSSANDFEKFLDREHISSPGIFLKVAKKSSGIASISFDEATEVALCFGWINGQGKPFDDKWSLSRFTPRRPKSTWSKRNVGIIAMLTEADRMRPAGIAAVEAAQADGRWDRAYDGPASIQVPDDFAVVLANNAAATTFFETLNKTHRYAVLWRVQTASPQNRAKRIETLIKTLEEGNVPGRPANSVNQKAEANAKVSKSKSKEAVKPRPKSRKPARPSLSLEDEQSRTPRRAGLRPRT